MAIRPGGKLSSLYYCVSVYVCVSLDYLISSLCLLLVKQADVTDVDCVFVHCVFYLCVCVCVCVCVCALVCT